MGDLIGYGLVIVVFLLFFVWFNFIIVYEYLERCFDVKICFFGFFCFLLFVIVCLGGFLYVVVLVLLVLIGISMNIVILMVGVVLIIYIVVGGIIVVVWMDVL